MKHRPSAYLRLVRPANVPTALADAAAGAAVALGAFPDAGRFALVLGASGLFYAAGMGLNDVFDLERDRTLHPERPLPSGRVSWRAAAVFSAGLLAAAMALSLAAGVYTGLAAFFVAGTILIYDGLLSHTAGAPVSMGACRAANLLLGASLAGPIPWPAFAAAGLLGLYTAGISLIARQERKPSALGLSVGWLPCAAAACAALVVWPRQDGSAAGLLPYAFALALLLWTGWRLDAARRRRTTPAVVALVKTCILALPLLDAVFVARLATWPAALAIAALTVPSWLLSRWFRMT